MKIAILSPYTPFPPNSGGRIRIWEQIRHLAPRHELTLVSFCDTEDEYRQRTRLNEYCRRVLMVRRPRRPSPRDLRALSEVSDLFRWYTTPEMASALGEIRSTRFDLALLHHIYMAQYRELVAGFPVLQEQNIESSIFWQVARLETTTNGDVDSEHRRAFRRSRWMLLRQYEDRTWPSFLLRTVVSEEDKRELDRRCRTGRTVVAENGVNTREIARLPLSTARRLLFMGSLDFYPNIDALMCLRDAILPRLWQRDPQVAVVIAGRNPGAAVRDLAEDSRIRVVPNPTDISALAGECQVSVVPQRIGGGTRMRILHAMALGVPVVSTSRGCEGQAVTDGQDILIRDAPEAFVDAILDLLGDRSLAERLSAAGRRLVEARYDWGRLLERWEAELLRVASSRGG